ncbi:MAG TPA: DUF4912 domain-containing protein [Planctomycetes bacterium]|nr:DUF4912 domain-containing protein [Planctomycetota bacterium]
MSRTELKSKTVKELGQKAKVLGITGYASMRKPALVTALVNKLRALKAAKTRAKTRIKNKRSAVRRTNANVLTSPPNITAIPLRALVMATAEKKRLKDLSNGPAFSRNGASKRLTRDRVVVLVRDSYWIQVCWEIKSKSVARAQAALAHQWHAARPIIRLYEVQNDSQQVHGTRVLRDIEIHGGVTNWYIDVDRTPTPYQVEIGYLADTGEFHPLCRSNAVTPPAPGSCDATDMNWDEIAKDYKRIFALSGGDTDGQGNQDLKDLFEQRLQRPMSKSVVMKHGLSGQDEDDSKLHFEVDSELIVYGNAEPDATVTMAGEPVKLAKDGSFTIRMDLPDRRKVFPLVAHGADGLREKTVVISIERNIKILEPTLKDRIAALRELRKG